MGNCDEFLYMGGNEQSTHEYVSKLLGKETIDTNTYGQSKGRSGSYSTNWQLTGRELLMPDEVRMLDNQYALLFIRGERPVRDLKYDILKHPNIKLTTDGGAEPYRHGEDVHSIVSIRFDKELLKQAAERMVRTRRNIVSFFSRRRSWNKNSLNWRNKKMLNNKKENKRLPMPGKVKRAFAATARW